MSIKWKKINQISKAFNSKIREDGIAGEKECKDQSRNQSKR